MHEIKSKLNPRDTFYLGFIVNVCHVHRTMIVKNEKDNLIRGIKKFTDVDSSTAIHHKTIFDALYIVLKGRVEILFASDRHQGVEDVVTLEEVLDDLGGAHGVHVGVDEHQDPLRGDDVEEVRLNVPDIHCYNFIFWNEV